MILRAGKPNTTKRDLPTTLIIILRYGIYRFSSLCLAGEVEGSFNPDLHASRVTVSTCVCVLPTARIIARILDSTPIICRKIISLVVACSQILRLVSAMASSLPVVLSSWGSCLALAVAGDVRLSPVSPSRAKNPGLGETAALGSSCLWE